MNNTRRQLIIKAFQKLDKSGDGVVTVSDLKGVYNVSKHKKYLSGEWTEDQCLGEFLESFESAESKDGQVCVTLSHPFTHYVCVCVCVCAYCTYLGHILFHD